MGLRHESFNQAPQACSCPQSSAAPGRPANAHGQRPRAPRPRHHSLCCRDGHWERSKSAPPCAAEVGVREKPNIRNTRIQRRGQGIQSRSSGRKSAHSATSSGAPRPGWCTRNAWKAAVRAMPLRNIDRRETIQTTHVRSHRPCAMPPSDETHDMTHRHSYEHKHTHAKLHPLRPC